MFGRPSASANIGAEQPKALTMRSIVGRLRRAVPSSAWIDRRCAMRIGVVMMAIFGRVFARSRLSVAGSDTGGWAPCWPARASR